MCKNLSKEQVEKIYKEITDSITPYYWNNWNVTWFFVITQDLLNRDHWDHLKFDIADRSCLQEVRRDGGRGAQLQGVLRDDPQQEHRLVPAQVANWELLLGFILEQSSNYGKFQL